MLNKLDHSSCNHADHVYTVVNTVRFMSQIESKLEFILIAPNLEPLGFAPEKMFGGLSSIIII